ncbi:hypothetical protein [Thiorhodovibrio frisius]|uniref:Uncharacterized protein n=1 Tax=Thiorhodovibrio frisius TaxID=631362 RepID=H8YWF6_9GAMM|nr:hypothetical protein [Thiorhodovibrio frisius]EIC22782.1 hypothetical protein Thi970DRAFT_00417 [Thiorhodovibrio frisius]WPL23112.1 hypothetical protein Thiofri_03295 [Thiorhodovibrio frisius]
MPSKRDSLSSRDLLARIGLDQELGNNDLLDDELLPDLTGNPGPALQERARLFAQTHRFAPGDLVTWKPGLKNRRVPRNGQPAVVLEVLSAPVFDSEKDAGSAYFREPLDLVLGLFLEDGPHRGDFLNWHFDSRRFQPWPAK